MTPRAGTEQPGGRGRGRVASVAAALYSAFAGELVRSRTFRRRYAPEQLHAVGRADVVEHD